MAKTTEESNKALILEAFDTLFNKRDYKAAERYWSVAQQAEAALAMDRAAVRTAELNLSYAEIRAPFAGRLGRN